MPGKQRPVRISVRRVSSRGATQRRASDRAGAVDDFLQGAVPSTDPKRLERSPRRRLWPFLLLLVGLAAAATAAGFAVFTRSGGKFSETGITVSVDLPAGATSGDELTLTVSYLNGQGVSLKRADLTLDYPSGFTVTAAEPEATGALKNAWSVGPVRPGLGGRVVIHGRLTGPLESEHAFTATLTYRPDNFNSDFTVRQAASTTITDSILSLTTDLPEKTVSGTATTFAVNVKNDRDQDIERVRLVLDEGEGFTLAEAKPAAKEDRMWTFDRLKASAQETVTVTGTFAGKTGQQRTLVWQAGVVSADGEFQPQASVTTTVTIANPDLALTVERDAEAGPTAELGERQRYVFSLTNNTDVVIEDVTVSGQFPVGVFDWASAAATPNATLTDAAAKGTVRWTKATVKSLAAIEPGGRATFTLSLPVAATLPATVTDRAATVTAKAETGRVESYGRSLEATATAAVKLGSTLKLVAEARYSGDEGEVIGAGPLPPTVGQTTTYRVRWILSNGINDVTDLTVQSALPTHAFWTGKVQTATAGTLAFDATARTVTWTINRVPALTGSKTAQLVAEFELSVTPKASDTGLLMVLTEKSAAKATDSVTAAAVQAERPSLTTDLPDDPQARGQGIVIAAS